MKWDTISLGDIALRKGGSVDPKKHPDEVFELYSIPAFDAGAPEVTSGSAIGSSKKAVQPNDVMISRIVPHIRRACVVGKANGSRQIASGEWIIFRDDKIWPQYLRWVLVGDVFHSAFMRTVSGVGGSLLRARPAEVFKIKIPLPPLAEQKRIAKILDAADALRAKRRESLALLDTLLQSTFLDMFGDPVTNPLGWEVRELAEVVRAGTIVTYGIVQAGDEYPGGVPYIRTGDLVDGKIQLDGLRHTDPTIAAKFKRSRVLTGEIVMSIRATVGTTARIPSQLDGSNLTQGTARISPGEDTELSFLLYFIRSQGSQAWLQKQVKGATFREITLKRLRQMPIHVPPLDLQHRFSAIAESVEQQEAKQRAHLSELDTLFASLQQRAFRGDL
jgi:type I restriction enzyme, S subunit